MDKIEKEVVEYFKKWSEKINDGTIKIKVRHSKMALDYIKPDEECLTYDEEGWAIYRYDTYYSRRDMTYGAYKKFLYIDEELNEDPLGLSKPGYESLPLDDINALNDDESDEITEESE